MPALILGGRRWHIAADDLPLPSILGAAWHAVLLGVTALDLAAAQQLVGCGFRARHTAYLSAHIACLASNCALHVWTYLESRRGALFQLNHRRRVPWLVLCTAAFYMLTIGVNAYGTSLLQQLPHQPACVRPPGAMHIHHRSLLTVIIIATWASLFTAVLAMTLTVNAFPACQASCGWIGRLLCCCCCCYMEEGPGPLARGRRSSGRAVAGGSGQGSRHSSSLAAVAEVFTEIFGRVDMTFSDHLAALTLVGVRHNHTKPALTYANAAPPSWLSAAAGNLIPGGAATDAGLRGWYVGAVMSPPPIVQLTASGRLHGGAEDGTANGQSDRLRNLHLTASKPDCAVAVSGPCTPASPPTTSAPGCASEPGDPQPATLPNRTDEQNLTSTTSCTNGSAMLHLAPGNGNTGQPDAGPGQPEGSLFPTAAVPTGYVSCAVELPLAKDAAQAGVEPQRDWSGTYAEPNVNNEVVEEALHYMRFATAVYGWKMYLWLNRQQVTCCCRLCWGRGCGCCRQTTHFMPSEGPDAVPFEGCCSPAKLLEREAITQMTGVSHGDILHVCYANRVGGLLPHYVALDRARRAVVVSVRGSLSVEDAVTDLLCEPARFEEAEAAAADAGCGPAGCAMWAHRGMLGSARAIAEHLRGQGVLRAALAPWPHDQARVEEALRGLPERARRVARRLRGECAGWRLVLTGHSLGAGVTGLLGPLLQRDFPGLRCWAFAAPAGLMSPQAAALTRSYCISVVHAKDMISRLGVAGMEQLVQELVHAAAHCAVSKAAVLGGMLRRGRRPGREALFLPTEQLSPEQRRALFSYNRGLEVSSRFVGARDFVPPGHVLYLERRKAQQPQQSPQQPAAAPSTCSGCCVTGASDAGGKEAAVRYCCRWIRVEDLVGRGLVVSRSMLTDHMPDVTLKALQQALEQLRLERMSGQSAGNGLPRNTADSTGCPAAVSLPAAPSLLGKPNALDGPGYQGAGAVKMGSIAVDWRRPSHHRAR